MNLIEQFPEAAALRRSRPKRALSHSGMASSIALREEMLASFYEKEFRKWHVKVLLMIGVGTIGMVYFMIKVPTIVNWIFS
jgi:hypothetical protein